ncbi:MAG: hypothetical protein RJQ08_02615 [Salinisphaeraceae bacterium]|mgnify:CR=1 FL=1|uniref:Uncharacterized protein n=2 Tax=Spectribacter TaxID=3160928 RepID=A0ABU3C2G7_9GAMM|nr:MULTISPECIES: hypothetical protein [unclassified Salinisphaera]MDT0618400.1 hypothetical protein [Salinisphaera sp. P385]MDT0635758.1 hypothetical protein [Salinisphaera sp. W335]
MKASNTQQKPWLTPIYQAKRERTVRLVRLAIEELQKKKQRVTLAAICSTSKHLDSEHKGISQSAIITNEDARRLFDQAKHIGRVNNRRARKSVSRSNLARLAVGRDTPAARRRLLRLTKNELVDRLTFIELEYADLHDRYARLSLGLVGEPTLSEDG